LGPGCTPLVRRSERMRLNLSQYSLPSGKLALSSESPDALDALKVKLRAEQQPANETEEILVNEMAEQFWRLRRARVIETSLLNSDQVLIPHLTAIQRMMSSAERGFYKALNVLRQLQKDRGFVPANSHPAEQTEPQPSREREGAVKLTAERCELTAPAGFVPPNSISEPAEPQPTRDLACQSTSALAREGAVKLTAERCELSAHSGFVPPPCPADEDIDPADWARAFATRNKVHAACRVASPGDKPSL
jgi:hypothetical protein